MYEVAFRTGDSPEKNTRADLRYMRELLAMIDKEGIPAPAPIEQRWSAGSKSPMSPVSNDGDESSPGLHSWVGIIMYLPTEVQEERDRITEAFRQYAAREEALLGDKYGIRVHWAKIELPKGEAERKAARETMAKRYPVDAFEAKRKELDPKGILANDMIEGLLGDPARMTDGEGGSKANKTPGEYLASFITSFTSGFGVVNRGPDGTRGEGGDGGESGVSKAAGGDDAGTGTGGKPKITMDPALTPAVAELDAAKAEASRSTVTATTGEDPPPPPIRPLGYLRKTFGVLISIHQAIRDAACRVVYGGKEGNTGGMVTPAAPAVAATTTLPASTNPPTTTSPSPPGDGKLSLLTTPLRYLNGKIRGFVSKRVQGKVNEEEAVTADTPRGAAGSAAA